MRSTHDSSAGILAVAGIRLASVAAGIRYQDRDDLVLIEIADGSICAGTFTRNAFCAAPVTVAREHLHAHEPRFLLINSGNANAGTGDRGLRDAWASCAAVAEHVGCAPEQVLPFSTGVIGEFLPVERIRAVIAPAVDALSEHGWAASARAIMTTDTRPKTASRQCVLGDHTITVTGMAKGSGMICPDMATMLAFLATDAAVDAPLLQSCIERAVAVSFNAITVDGDTSTNDACVLLATGQARNPTLTDATHSDFESLCATVQAVSVDLAKALVADAEGATKFITIRVHGGRDESECRRVAYCVAHSPLVKTAFFAADPNWGRILAAVGRSGLPEFNIDDVRIDLDEVCIVSNGGRDPDYTEERGQQVMARESITVSITLERGSAETCLWTCDLSHDYVQINAEYRT